MILCKLSFILKRKNNTVEPRYIYKNDCMTDGQTLYWINKFECMQYWLGFRSLWLDENKRYVICGSTVLCGII